MRKILSSRSSLLLIIAALAVAMTIPAWGQAWKGRGRIQGKVTDTDEKPIAGATVHLFYKGQEGVGPEVLTTKKNGRWAYSGLSTATYTVRIEAEGYYGSEGNMKVNEYGDSARMEIALRTLEEAPPTQDPGEGERLMTLVEEGNHLMTQKKFVEARDRFEQVLAKLEDPQQRTQLERAIAGTYLEEGNTAEAKTRFGALLASTVEPAQQADLRRAVARAHYVDSNIDGSVGELKQALELVPNDPQTLRLLVDILVGAGRESEAEPYMALLPEGEKVDADAMLNLGITAYNGGDLDTAIEKFQKVADAYPENSNAHYYLGLVHMGKMQNPQAIQHLEKMLELEPGHANAGEAKQFLEYLKSL